MNRKNGTSLMLLGLYALLIAALLVLVVAGARLYGAAVDGKTAHSEKRSALSYIQSLSAGFEGRGRITVEDGPEGSMLCLTEQDGSYVTRIYCFENALRSQLSHAGEPVQPENSERICSLEDFSLTWESETLLRITADGREGYVCCTGGGPNA